MPAGISAAPGPERGFMLVGFAFLIPRRHPFRRGDGLPRQAPAGAIAPQGDNGVPDSMVFAWNWHLIDGPGPTTVVELGTPIIA